MKATKINKIHWNDKRNQEQLIELKISFENIEKKDRYSRFEIKQIKAGESSVRCSINHCIGDFSFKHTKFKGINISVFQKLEHKEVGGYIIIPEKFRSDVCTYMIYNYNYNCKYLSYKTFKDAMRFLYLRSYQKRVPNTEKSMEYEARAVDFIINNEIDRFRKLGETKYRKAVREEYPDYFVQKEKAHYLYADIDKYGRKIKNAISYQVKTNECNKRRYRDEIDVVIDVFNKKVIPHMDKYMTKGKSLNHHDVVYNQILFDLINDSLKKHGFRTRKESGLKRMIQKAVFHGTGGLYNYVRSFMNGVILSKADLSVSITENAKNLRINRNELRKASCRIFSSNVFKGYPTDDFLNLFNKSFDKPTEETGKMNKLLLDAKRMNDNNEENSFDKPIVLPKTKFTETFGYSSGGISFPNAI